MCHALPDGRRGFHCFSDECAGLTWKDLREKYEPDRAGRVAWNGGALTPDGLTDYRTKAGSLQATTAGASAPGVGVAVETVRAEEVEWLWRGRIPFGAITTLDGDPEMGKSMMTLDWAARVSRGGEWPDRTRCPIRRVLILSAEDNWANTIRPRLEAAGGHLANVFLVPALFTPPGASERKLFSLPEDLEIIAAEVRLRDAGLLVVDPLNAYLAGAIDTHRDHHVRRALAPLADVAERTRAAVVIVRHLNKGGGSKAIYRGMGSIAYTAAARVGYVAARDSDDAELRHLACVKSNLAAPPATLDYRVRVDALGLPFIEWAGTSALSAAEVLASEGASDSPEKLNEAMTFLREELSGGPVDAKQAKADARVAAIAEITLRRAQKRLRVRPEKAIDPKSGRVTGWIWRLPENPDAQGD
jgi:hypothetical protein